MVTGGDLTDGWQRVTDCRRGREEVVIGRCKLFDRCQGKNTCAEEGQSRVKGTGPGIGFVSFWASTV